MRENRVAIALLGSNVGEGETRASAVRSTARSDSEGQPLIGPIRRHVHQTRNAEAAWKGSIDRRLNDVWSEEGERKSHAGRSFTDAFTSCDRLNTFDPAGNHFFEPPPPLGDGG